MIPVIAGVSDLQRRGKAVLAPVRDNKEKIVFLSDRNHVFGVVMNIAQYEELLKLSEMTENDFWSGAMEKSLDFWNDKSNDAYEKLL